MLHTLYNLISENDLKYLQQICEDFDARQIDKIEFDEKTNFYNRLFIKQTELQNYQEALTNFLKQNLNKHNFSTVELSEPDTWINKIVPETNKKDSFHVDSSYLTAVTYLNENFTGGNFEYTENAKKPVRVRPKIGMTLIMDKTLYHRVTPVKTGTRFSLVTFFQSIPKKSKTLL